MNKITVNTIRSYVQKLHERGEPASSVLQKLSSVDKFVEWAFQKGYIDNKAFKQIKEEIANNIERLNEANRKEFDNRNVRTVYEPHFTKVETGKPNIEDFEKANYSGEKKTEGFAGEVHIKFNLQTYKIKSFIFGVLKRIPLLNYKSQIPNNKLQTSIKSQATNEWGDTI